MKITIEKAHPGDIDELEILYNDVCDHLAGKEYNPGWRKGCFPTREDAAHFLEDDALYAARTDGKIIASMALSHSPNGPLSRKTLKLYDFMFMKRMMWQSGHMRKTDISVSIKWISALGNTG